MTKIYRFAVLALVALASVLCASAQQNTLVQTSLSAAITSTQSCFAVASATGINAASTTTPGSDLYIVDPGRSQGELVRNISSISGTTVCGRRTGSGGSKSHPSGAMVLVATAPNWFATTDPIGKCSTTAGTVPDDKWGSYVTPVLNTTNGKQWLCSSVTSSWVPGFQGVTAEAQPTVAVASAAGKITPSGPFFHVTGTAAVTGFNIPVGYNGGPICVIPDGIFTTTNANNFAIATTAVVSKQLCYLYDTVAAKFYPSY